MAGIAAAIILAAPSWAAADLDRTINFNIASQPLDTALLEFSQQAQIQLAINGESLRQITAPRINGKKMAGAALTELLVDTGLGYATVGHTVTVSPLKANAETTANSPTAIDRSTTTSTPVRTAMATSSAGSPSTSSSAKPAAGDIAEVLVTAEKRSERLQDVPVPVTAIVSDALVDSNQLRLQDYYTLVPGLNVTTGGFNGASTLAIRGITTGIQTTPTVGIVIDDVPFGASTAVALGSEVPDIDPSDLARVEVLRGPQGTLYGASSIGGLLKFVTVDPSTEALSGRFQGGLSHIQNGSEVGYNVRGAVNIPLTDSLAVRVSGFTREDPGYINNVQTGEKGVNSEKLYGARLSTLWRPNEDFSAKFSALFQHSALDGSPEVDQALGDLQQSRLRGTGWYDKSIQAYSLTLTARLGTFDLTSLSGYDINKWSDAYDFTFALGPITEFGVPGSGFDGFGVSGTPLTNNVRTNKFTEEVRVSTSFGEHLDWLAGIYYNHEKTQYSQSILAEDPASGNVVGSWLYNSDPTGFVEYAAFTDLTFHVTDRFDVQLGGRESHNTQTYEQIYIGQYDPALLGLPSPVLEPEVETKDNSFTYLVTPRFKISPDLMVYARLASGYRPGGPNPNYLTNQVPQSFGPDKTQNYELGIKGNVLSHMFTYDASIYYIDWKAIQLSFVNPVTFGGYTGNGSRAKSQGLELSLEARPISGLTLSTWVAFNDAKLTRDLPTGNSNFGAAGDRLPYSSRFSGNFSAEQDFPLTDSMTGYVGGSVSYVGERQDVFASIFSGSPDRQALPAYAKTDLHAGVRYNTWNFNAFLSNATDRRGLLTGGTATLNPAAFSYIQPRMVGASISKTF